MECCNEDMALPKQTESGLSDGSLVQELHPLRSEDGGLKWGQRGQVSNS